MKKRESICINCKKILLPGEECHCIKLPVPTLPVENYNDDYCAYQALGMKCKNIGFMSPDLDENAKWYCLEHYRALGDAQLCEAILYSQKENKS